MLGSIKQKMGAHYSGIIGGHRLIGFPNAVKTSLVKLGQCSGDRQFLQLLFRPAINFAERTLVLNLCKFTCQNEPARPFCLRQSPVAVARVDE